MENIMQNYAYEKKTLTSDLQKLAGILTIIINRCRYLHPLGIFRLEMNEGNITCKTQETV